MTTTANLDTREASALSSPLLQFDLTVHGGMNFIHVPLRVNSVDGREVSIETLGDLYEILEEVNYLIVFDSAAQSWVHYYGDRAADRELRRHEGVVALMNKAKSLRLVGEALDNSINIDIGVTLVGIPRRPSESYSIRELFAIVPGMEAIVIEENGRFVTVRRTDDDGNILITGGQALLLVSTESASVSFSGELWGTPREEE